jgi:hypothetical protein
VDFLQRADGAVVDPALDRRDVRAVAGGKEVRGDLRLAGRLNHQPRLVEAVGQRLVHQDVLALLHRGDRDGSVEVVRRHDLDGVHVLSVSSNSRKSA